jgi:aspartate/methionine/tyrosine aminotransferase
VFAGEDSLRIDTFRLERYFAEHEFTAQHLLSASDCESLALPELLALADDETRDLWDRLWLGYTESAGHPLLRAEIARLYRGLAPADTLVAAPEEAIFILMNALLEPGDEVVITWPAYQSLGEIARAIGCKLVRWELRVAGGEWQLDPAGLAALLTPRTRLVVVNFPHNPTGFLPAPGEWDSTVRTVAERGVVLFSDEMYRWLEYDEAQTLPSACEVYEKAVTLGGVSKSLGLPGLRIGWLASRDRDLLRRAGEIKDYTTICSSAPSEVLAVVGLRAREWLVGRNLAIVQANLREAEKYFGHRRTKYEWLAPLAGPVAFPRWIGGPSAQQWADETIRDRGVMIAPGEVFDMPGHFRVGLGRRGFRAALQAL